MPSSKYFSVAAVANIKRESFCHYLARQVLTSFVLCPLLFLLPSSAVKLDANVIEAGVDINHQINFTDPYFADASWSTTLAITLAPSSSGSRDFSMLFYPYNNGLTFFSTGSVTIDQTSRPSDTASAIVRVTANGGGTFGFLESASWQELSPDAIDPLVLFTSTLTGRRDLNFVAPSGGYSLPLDPGITWQTSVSMPGDWSTGNFSDLQGAHYLEGYDSDWSLTNNFTYNPSTNRTTVSFLNSNYEGADSEHDGPYPEFALIGPVVPEPSEFVLTAVGLIALVVSGSTARGRYRSRIRNS